MPLRVPRGRGVVVKGRKGRTRVFRAESTLEGQPSSVITTPAGGPAIAHRPAKLTPSVIVPSTLALASLALVAAGSRALASAVHRSRGSRFLSDQQPFAYGEPTRRDLYSLSQPSLHLCAVRSHRSSRQRQLDPPADSAGEPPYSSSCSLLLPRSFAPL